MIQRGFLLAAAAAIAFPLSAATTYRVERGEKENAARVAIDGAKIRVDYEIPAEQAIANDALISTNGGKSWIGLNSRLKTWYRIKADELPPFTPTTARIGRSNAKARKMKWTFNEQLPSAGGMHTYIGKLTYVEVEDMGGTGVSSRCTASVEIRSNGSLDQRWLGELPFRVRNEELNAQVAPSAAAIAGFPLSVSFTATKQYDRGPVMKEEETMTVRDIKDAGSVDPHLFETPKGYIEKEPLLAVPGVVSK